MLKILARIALTSNTCERSISSLRRLKDYTKNIMTNERLNGLAQMYIHREIPVDIYKVIDTYRQSKITVCLFLVQKKLANNVNIMFNKESHN